MKIGLVVPGGVDRSGEVAVIPALLALIERLARRHEVHVFALYQYKEPVTYDLLGAKVHVLGLGRSRIRAVGSVLREHKREPFAVLHGFWLGTGGVVAVVAAGLAGVGSVVHVAGGELVALDDIGYGGDFARRNRFVNRLVLALADRVSAASGTIVDLVEGSGHAATLVPLGVDLDRWPLCPPRRRAAEEQHHVLAVGSINRVKGFDTLIRAVAQLAARGVNVAVDIVGEDTLAGQVQDLAASHGVDSSISFHGFLRHADLRALMDRASVFAVTSHHEAGPVAALEAVVAGVPVVGTDVGHLRDWREFGLAPVPPGDWRCLAREIAGVITDRDNAVRVTERIQSWAATHDADWTATAFERMYRAVRG